MKSKFRWMYSVPSLKPTHLVVGICIVVVHGWIGAMWVWRMGSVLNLHLWWGTGLVTNTLIPNPLFMYNWQCLNHWGVTWRSQNSCSDVGWFEWGWFAYTSKSTIYIYFETSSGKNAIVAIPGWGMLTPDVSIPEPHSSAPTPGTGAEIGLPWGPEWSSLLKSPSSVISWLF